MNARLRKSTGAGRLRLLKLEQRILFDGALVAEAAQAVTDPAPAGDPHPDAAPAPAAAAPAGHEIAFIDVSLPNAGELANGVRAGVEIVWLQPGSDPWAQMTAALAARPGAQAVHLLSHGSDGVLNIGGASYDTAGLAGEAPLLQQWQGLLASGADVLLYGCNVARDGSGESFVDTLAGLTGTDVAASRDSTGSSALSGDWNFEYQRGDVTAEVCLTLEAAQRYDATLSAFSLLGKDGWTAVMYGPNKDPDGDSQAGAADTDIIGDSAHGSLYVAFDDNGTPNNPNDDFMAFRMRIDNPTSSTNCSGVAIVGMDANLDGRIDIFFSVDGRNNTQAVRLLDPGTGANLSPNTTTTSPLPTGWLPNNGLYPFATSNYSVAAVSAGNDPNWGASQLGGSGTASDLTGDGKTDVFISWKVPLADVATVLAKPSQTDRSGVYGPRGATGIQGFNKDTAVAYVSFTQTQPGPINGDLNGVGASYDKNATFAALGAFTTPMSPSNPVSAADAVHITTPLDANGLVNATEDNGLTVSGTATANGWVRVTITDTGNAHTTTLWTQANASGNWSVGSGDLSNFAQGSLQFSADLVSGNASTSIVTGSASDSTTLTHDSLPPVISITPLATTGTPTISGTSTDVPAGSTLTVTIDPNGDGVLTDLVSYAVLVGSGGNWTLNTAIVAPSSGSLPAGGLTSHAKITASGQDAAGNSASTIALAAPTVNSLSTTQTTPTLTGTWLSNSGDVLTVSVNGQTYTAGDGRLTTTATGWSLTIPGGNALGVGTYNVVATATRGGDSISDSSSGELVINAVPVVSVGITSGSSGSAIWPTITGSSSTPNSYVIVRLDPGNDGNLSDAVTYSVATDGSGNWSLDTSSMPIAGQKPAGGFTGSNGVRATDSNNVAVATQVLTITTPSVAISGISSTASTNAAAVVSNSAGGASWLNLTEDDAVTISGTAAGASQVDLVITDANGHHVSVSGVSVTSGNWSATGINLSALDNGVLTVTATLSGTAVSATDSSVTHDTLAPRIFNTTPGEIKKNGGVIKGGSELANTSLTVTVAESGTTKWTGTVTTDASGNWTATTSGNLVSGSTGTVIITVAPTSQATDTAGNIAQALSWSQAVTANATTNTISIGTIAGDNLITSGEIASGVTLSGTTTLTGTPTINLVVSDGTTSVNLTASAASGAWSTTLTNAQIKTLANGPLTVTATAPDGGITIRAVALPTLSLPAPVPTITDNVAGTATGPVTFTFTFSEDVTGFVAGNISVSNGTAGTFSTVDAHTYTLVVTPTAASSGNISVSVAAAAATGSTTGRTSVAASATQAFETTGAATAPTLTINTDNLATDRTPLITGTTSLSAGAPIVVWVDTDNDGVNDVSYAATVQAGGNWSIDLGTATPSSGSLPANGIPSDARITAVATNAYGNSTTATGHNKPAVNAQRSNDNTPTVSGTWTNLGGDTLSVLLNGTTYSQANGNLTISGDNWSLTPASALPDATYEVTATVTRGGTGKTDVSSNELIVDTAAPAVAITGISTDTGSSGTDYLTRDNTLVFSGTAEADSQVLVSLRDASNAIVFSATVTATGGAWSVDRSAFAALADGTYRLTAVATDAAGNSATATQDVIVDTQASIGFTTNYKLASLTPVITGTTDIEAGRSLDVVVSGATYSVIVQSGGTWSLDLASAVPASGSLTPLADGSEYAISISGTDRAGNSASAGKTVLIDLSAPTVSISTPIDSAGDGNSILTRSEDGSVVIQGTTTAPLGATLQISITDGSQTITDTTTVQNGGLWQLGALNLRNLANGTLTITATYVDASGTPVSAVARVLHDKSGPVSIDSVSNDTRIATDFITSDNTLVFRGSATAGDSVAVTLDGNLLGSVTADAQGAWSYDYTSHTLADGNHTLSVNTGGTPVTQLIVIDTTAPGGPVTVSSLSTSDSTPLLSGSATLGAGETLSVTVNGKTYTDGDGALSYNAVAHSWSLQIPDADALTPASVSAGFNGVYNVTATIRDTAGNSLSDASTGELTIADTTPPVIDLAPSDGTTISRSLTSSNGAQVSLDNNADALTLTEASNRLTRLTLSVSGLADGASEALSFGSTTLAADGSAGGASAVSVGGVSVNIAYASGVFTIQKADYRSLSTAEAQSILRDIQYRNTAGTVTVGNRSFGFGAQDEAGNSASTATATVAVTNGAADSTAPAAPTLTLLAASDTGTSSSDAKTNDSTPTLRVTLNGSGATAPVAGDVVKLYQGAALVGSATLSSGDISAGYVDITASVQSAGGLSFTANITDAASNLGADSNAVALTLDTTAPALSSASVSGSTLTLSYAEAGVGLAGTTPSTSDFIVTKNGGTGVTVSGVVVDTTAKTVTLTLGAAITNADSNILVSYTPGGTTLQDIAGNAAAAFSNQAVTNASGDSTAPAAPTLALLASSDSGTSNSDAKTHDTTPTLRVTLNGTGATAPVAGDVVKLYQGASLVGSATLSSGDISAGYIDITASAQSAGGLSFTANITDAASNLGADSNAVALTLDTTAPALLSGRVSGSTLTLSYNEAGVGLASSTPSASDFVVSKNGGTGVTVAGVVVDPTAKTVTLTLASAITNADSNVRVSYTPGGTALQDIAGNAAAAFSSQSVTNASPDTTAPVAPTLALLPSSDTGASSSDAKTNDSTPTLRVTLNGSGATAPVAGDVVKLYQGDVLVGSATLSSGDISSGYVDITASAQSEGSLSFTAGITDTTGNAGDMSRALAVNLDTRGPGATIVSSVAVHNGQDAFELQIRFDEPVQGVSAAGIELGGARLLALRQIDASTWALSLQPQGNTTVSASVRAAAASDEAGNPSLASSVVSVLPRIVTPAVPAPTTASPPIADARAPASLGTSLGGSDDSFVLPAVREVQQGGAAAGNASGLGRGVLGEVALDASLHVLPAVSLAEREGQVARALASELATRLDADAGAAGTRATSGFEDGAGVAVGQGRWTDAAEAERPAQEVSPLAGERLPTLPEDTPSPAAVPLPTRTSFTEQLRRHAAQRIALPRTSATHS
ncbi:Ig-like domain-containing protein [Uliginosibacterium paludis]|uniref:Ig-like domain-containing protein n=1 Tax=Uliginosibacterium paludis TaxID=1615952 RepID=A0ABV2CT68_9RHOO